MTTMATVTLATTMTAGPQPPLHGRNVTMTATPTRATAAATTTTITIPRPLQPWPPHVWLFQTTATMTITTVTTVIMTTKLDFTASLRRVPYILLEKKDLTWSHQKILFSKDSLCMLSRVCIIRPCLHLDLALFALACAFAHPSRTTPWQPSVPFILYLLQPFII
ncbi:hypothetical protein BJV78DRAFT_802588 [Lactifluus subvellereus]|nr:hypothetical protein BJV78DRAFT_802588 [Lactifluus subvellereus]